MPAALRRPQKKQVLDFQSMSRSENITFLHLVRRFYTFLHLFTRLYSFVLGNNMPAALRRPQKKHVLDFQSMSQPKNITDFVYFWRAIPNSWPVYAPISLSLPLYTHPLTPPGLLFPHHGAGDLTKRQDPENVSLTSGALEWEGGGHTGDRLVGTSGNNMELFG